MPLWFHLGHFIFRVFVRCYMFLGTSPGGITAQVAVLVLTEVGGGWWRLSSWKKNWRGGFKRGVYSLVAVWAVAFAGCTITTIYDDHLSLVQANKRLQDQISLLKGDSPFAIRLNDEFSSISNTIQALKLLEPSRSARCFLRITAPRENREIAKVLANLGENFCEVDATYNPAEPEDEVLHGSVRDAVLVHMKKTTSEREGFTVDLQNTFSVYRTYELPANLPDGAVWIQIGKGSPWRKDPTR